MWCVRVSWCLLVLRVVWGGLGVRAVVVATIVHGLVCLKMCLPSHDIVVSMFTIMFGVNPAHIMTHVHNNRTFFQKPQRSIKSPRAALFQHCQRREPTQHF